MLDHDIISNSKLTPNSTTKDSFNWCRHIGFEIGKEIGGLNSKSFNLESIIYFLVLSIIKRYNVVLL